MTVRLCARLETKGNQVIKGLQLEGLRVVGPVSEIARRYYEAGIDELIVSDSTSSWFSTQTTVALLSQLVEDCFVPITIGGGIRKIDDVDDCLRAGAERVSINTAAFTEPNLFSQIAHKYGRQSVVLHIQARRIRDEYFCFYSNGREKSLFTLESFLQSLPIASIGEILLNSIDNDGTQNGPDLELVEKTINYTQLPVIYSGGVGKTEHIASLCRLTVGAVAIGAALHYKKMHIDEIKRSLISDGFSVRT